MRRAETFGRSFLGAALVGSGLLQLVTSEFVRLVPQDPAGAPASPVWPYSIGVVLVAAGGAMLLGRMTVLAGTVVAGLILLSLVFRALPRAMANPWAGFVWTNPLKALALAGGAVLAGLASPGPGSIGVKHRRVAGQVATVGLAIFLLFCGVQHFVYRDFVATMVPGWIPPGRMFWTYFSGVALILGGAGLLLHPVARWAGALSALMIFLWVPLLHIPRAIAGPAHANETAGFFEALAISGVALLVAATRR